MAVPDLKRRILRNNKCAVVFRLGKDVYVVGGYIRDLIMKGVHSSDIDFIVPKNVRQLAVSVADELRGSVVELKKERMTRVALKGGATLDFSRMEGDIINDLRRRDFTINAMAWSPSTGLLDPTCGAADIKRRVIKSISDDNLVRDPLRLLRAYRFSAETGMRIESKTRSSTKWLSELLRQAASERITLEFFKMLNSDDPSNSIYEAESDGILNKIILLKNNKLKNNIKLLSLLESNVKKIHERRFLKEFSQGLTFIGLLRLEALMLGADWSGSKLSLSNDIRRRAETCNRLYSSVKKVNKADSYALYGLFSSADAAVFDLILLTGRFDLRGELARFETLQRREFLETTEIMALTGKGEGRELGRILHELKRMRFAGAISGRKDARRWLRSLRSY